jgi:hypothetical protein
LLTRYRSPGYVCPGHPAALAEMAK